MSTVFDPPKPRRFLMHTMHAHVDQQVDEYRAFLGPHGRLDRHPRLRGRRGRARGPHARLAVKDAAERLAGVFAAENPRFDRARFLAAAIGGDFR